MRTTEPGLPRPEQAGAYELAYNEAVRALSQQETVLDGLRSRAGILLSAAAIATSFLGGQALGGREPSASSWFAIVFFVVMAVATLVILWPRQNWAFAAVPSEMIATYIEVDEPLPIPAIHRDLALHMENSYVENERRLKDFIWAFRIGAFFLILEVGAWTVSLATA